jgi:hypothetical protein
MSTKIKLNKGRRRNKGRRKIEIFTIGIPP